MAPHRKDNNTVVARVADKFGGMADLARLLDLDPSAVRHWQVDRDGRIPDRWHAPILALARKKRVRVTAKDLVGV
jgi:hypothetical protein